jgi:hypothetical protein
MRYPSLQLGTTGNPKTPDHYNQEATLICPGCIRVIACIGKKNVAIQFGVMPQGKGASEGAVVWQSEEFYFPISVALGRVFDAVRVRNYAAGEEAEVFVNVA